MLINNVHSDFVGKLAWGAFSFNYLHSKKSESDKTRRFINSTPFDMYVTRENCSSVISAESLTPNWTQFHFMDVSHIQRITSLTINICKPLTLTPYEQKAGTGLRSRKKGKTQKGLEKRTLTCKVGLIWAHLGRID